MSVQTRHRVPRLLVRLPLGEHESVVSFMQRHAEANRAVRMLDLLRLVERISGEPLKEVREVVHSRAALQAVEWLTGLEDGALASRHLSRVQDTHLRAGHHFWPKNARISSRQAICPSCLREEGCARTSWEFVQAPVCLIHGLALVECCPSCSTPLRHSRTRLFFCGECGTDLRKSPVQTVTDGALDAARLVQQPAMVPMGDANSTAPVDETDLSRLLRLCVRPGPGRVSTYGLTEDLASLSVKDRVLALERLGAAMVGRRIDSGRLRSVILQRWPGIDRFTDDAVLPLLKAVALEVELEAEVTRLLCHGHTGGGAQTAAEVYRGRPPQLSTVREVAKFLGIDDSVEKQLRKQRRFPAAEPGYGYDLDHVLALKRWMDALCPPADLDAAFGWPGLTDELVKLRLLEGLKAADGHLLGVDVESVAGLVSRIQSALVSSGKQTAASAPLNHGRHHGMDSTAMAWAVAQVVSGSLPAFDWPEPIRLTDLRVDERRLRALAAESQAT